MAYDVVGICKAYTDEWVRITDSDFPRLKLVKAGSRETTIAEIQAILRMLPPGRKIAGGPIANTVAGIANLGGNAAFIGKCGDDERGRIFLDDYSHRNVFMDRAKSVTAGGDTACCMVLVTPDGERSFIHNEGVSMDLNNGDMDAAILSDTKFVFFGLPFLYQSHLPVLHHAVSLAPRARKVINLQSYDPSIRTVEFTRALLNEIDIVIGNEHEFANLCRHLDYMDTGELSCEVGRDKMLCETCGKNGVRIFDKTNYHYEPVRNPAPITVIDSTGAGDAFAAGLLFGLARDWPVEKAAQLGHRCAADILTVEGARPTQSWKHLIEETRSGGNGGVASAAIRAATKTRRT